MATAIENAPVKIEELPAPTIGENPDWVVEYNSLPAANKKLIEFIVSRQLIMEKDPVKIKDEGSFKDVERRNHMFLSLNKLLNKALEEEKKYTKGRVDKLKQYDDEYHEALKEFRKCPHPERLNKPEGLVDRYGLKLEELKEWDKLNPSEKFDKVRRAIEDKYKGVTQFNGILEDLKEFNRSNNLLGFIRKMNLKMEELKEWDKLKFNEKSDKIRKAIDDKYIDKYLDVMFDAKHREHAEGIKPYKREEREGYKSTKIKENNIDGMLRLVSRSIDTDHYFIVSQLNNVFQPQRVEPSEGWKRGSGNAR